MAEQKQIQKKILSALFSTLRGKFILCYLTYAYVASENQTLAIVFQLFHNRVITGCNYYIECVKAFLD